MGGSMATSQADDFQRLVMWQIWSLHYSPNPRELLGVKAHLVLKRNHLLPTTMSQQVRKLYVVKVRPIQSFRINKSK